MIRYIHKTGRRKVKIKVGGWLHVALDALAEAGEDRRLAAGYRSATGSNHR